MDYTSPYFNTTIAGVFALLLFSCYLQRKWKSRAFKGKLAPQPLGAWPLIGHFALLARTQDPHLTLSALADKYGPVLTMRIGVHPVLVVSSSEVAKEIFTTNDANVTFRPALVAAKLLGYNYAFFPFSPGGPYWRETRKISVLELLSNRRSEVIKHIRTQEVETSIKELYRACMDKQSIEMKQWFSDLNLDVLLRMVIGKKYFGAGAVGDEKEGRRFQEVIKVLFHYLGMLFLRDAVPFLGWMDVGGHEKAMKNTAKELDDFMEKWLQEHKRKRYNNLDDAEAEKDFMDVMLSILVGKSLEGYDADTINKATCLSLIAGNGTVAVAMTWALALLLNNQPVLNKAQKELDKIVGKERLVDEKDIKKLDYLQAIVKETLRLYPPAFIPGPRQFIEDCTIGGYHVPKNTWLMVNVWKIQRDPRVWPDPAEFKPERFLTTHKNVDVWSQNFELLPFGGGRRGCPGASHSLHMIHLTLATLLHAFEISTPTDAAIDMTPGIGLTNMKMTPLEAVVSPRLPPSCFE
ncbi:cytochrome P450 CYP82D47 [Manihot esculenta]|uniref:Cytochrome P450 n=1 Tax=Manihot esculenta TaxID=3983 RepID=A0A2C9VZG2_MANES|nr:cytochrome P450 CYP82D47 [Manihot esculenta]OAY50860.1 hypothetical protein MANES_05G168100v8 [Manihot esculenta]